MAQGRGCPCWQALDREPTMTGPQDCPYPTCLSENIRRPQKKGHWGQINIHWSSKRDVYGVAKAMGCSVTTVRRRLSEGPPVFRGLYSPYSRKEKKYRNEQIVKLYLAGAPIAILAQTFHCSRQRIWQILGPRKERLPK